MYEQRQKCIRMCFVFIEYFTKYEWFKIFEDKYSIIKKIQINKLIHKSVINVIRNIYSYVGIKCNSLTIFKKDFYIKDLSSITVFLIKINRINIIGNNNKKSLKKYSNQLNVFSLK